MAQTWPATVPDDFLWEGYRETPPNNVIRTSMDVGPDKIRRRSTAAVSSISCKMVLTKTQLGYFDTFYNTTLVNGSLTFDLTHPRTGSSKEMRFQNPPEYIYISGNYWSVLMQLEVLP